MIKLRNVEKCYQIKAGFSYVLRQINLDIAAGEFILDQQGTTIVQVTHNEAWAAYGSRVIRLKDGWMEK